ncbi:hypothetical protein UFOVP529_89 [uncultured Caudovirales phage]|uniref:Uncharacterized protein n=1 Tax=uncultured Caudovirales phage TaxID=2100421 RepID=A0A6J5REJ5_9CAUD|nr:hypothetical protein UFOVP529_89 [uncultured Caudovirales phage]CAB4190002.1 hypothetical protein UFOVP1191_27 [uncultured Caudovirales phage]CAB4194382.1 hypothetical protein UFOVP1252_32 [uncultured Caudovirales phage]
MKIHPDFKKLRDIAEGQGWVISLRANGHLVWLSPSGAKVYTSATPSDHRAVKNIQRDLRRYGLKV